MGYKTVRREGKRISFRCPRDDPHHNGNLWRFFVGFHNGLGKKVGSREGISQGGPRPRGSSPARGTEPASCLLSRSHLDTTRSKRQCCFFFFGGHISLYVQKVVPLLLCYLNFRICHSLLRSCHLSSSQKKYWLFPYHTPFTPQKSEAWLRKRKGGKWWFAPIFLQIFCAPHVFF